MQKFFWFEIFQFWLKSVLIKNTVLYKQGLNIMDVTNRKAQIPKIFPYSTKISYSKSFLINYTISLGYH